MKTKIDVFGLSEMTVKDYQSKVKNEFRRLEGLGETTNIVVLSEFLFKCGTVGAAVIVGEFSGELEKFYKEKKKERSKEKDFGVGECKFETNNKGNVLRINLTEGAVSPSRVEKGMKKSKLKVAAIISKGEEIAQVENEEAEDISPKTEATANNDKEKNNDNNQLAELMDKIKTQFQAVREILPQAAVGNINPDEQKTLTNLQAFMQNWFKLYGNSSPDIQQNNKEQGLKLKEQFAKIAGLLSKTNSQTEAKLEQNDKQLSASVGKNGENLSQDVLLVQEALNKFNARLNVTGQFDSKTLLALEALERAKFGSSESLVTPNSKLWKLLASR